MFYIPFTALGFEMCSDYGGRVKLQGIRSAMNMLANVLGPGLAWTLFFSHNEVVRATSVEENYLRMGMTFAAVSACSVIYVLFATRSSNTMSRRTGKCHGHVLLAWHIASYLRHNKLH